MNNERKKWDLSERTTKFGEEIIRFCKKVPRGPIEDPLVTQLVKAGTSVGANYGEADNAVSKKDFKYKISIVKKEAEESKHFIGMIVVAVPSLESESEQLWNEARELHMIFSTIYNKLK